MILARTIGERVTLWCMRAVATLVTMVGGSVLTASLATVAAPLPGDLARLLPVHAVRFGAALVIGGLLALYLTGSRAPLFRGERVDPAMRPPAPESWKWGFVLTLLVAPAVMLWQLEPLARFWRDTFQLLAGLGPWELRAGDNAGLVLIPLFGMLALPTFETLAAAAFAGACAFLLTLVAARSRLQMRAVLTCATLLGALAMGALLADDTMGRILPALERMILETSTGFPDETRQAVDALERYRRVTGHSAHVLAWAWMALGLWVPLLVLRALSEARALASAEAVPGSPATPPYEAMAAARFTPAAAPAEGADRERFYADAARLVDEGGAGGRGRPTIALLIVVLALLGLFALISGFGAFAAISRIVTR